MAIDFSDVVGCPVRSSLHLDSKMCDRQPTVGYYANPSAALAERGSIAQRYAAELRDANEREWSMDEIEAEIKATRRERKASVRG